MANNDQDRGKGRRKRPEAAEVVASAHYGIDNHLQMEAAPEFITPTMARDWLEHYLYERQRSLDTFHIDRIAYAIQQRKYSAQGITLCQVEGEERWHLTNGQHRLRAVIKADQGVWEVVTRKRGLTPAQVAEEYGRTDQVKKRSIADALKAAAVGQEYGLKDAEIKSISAGIAVVVAGFSYTKPEIRNRLHLQDPDERVAVTIKWMPAGAKYFDTIRGAQRGRYRHLVLAATVGVGLVTFSYTPERAQEFWHTVAHESGGPDDPAMALLRYFSDPSTGGGEERAKGPLVARRVARAWNAFYTGEGLSQIRSQDGSRPIEIAGSPYTGLTTPSYLDPGNQ